MFETPESNAFLSASESISSDMSRAVTLYPLFDSSIARFPVPQAVSHTFLTGFDAFSKHFS